MDFNNVIDARYSVRKYSQTPVEQDKIERILKSANVAPTAKNTNCVRVYAITDKQVLQKMKEISPCTFDAPLIFAVASDENEAWISSATNTSRGMMDASIAATYMMLTAVNEGLGTCWVCLFEPQGLKDILSMPDNIVPHCLIVAGYAANDAEPSPRHTQRIALAEQVTYVK